MVNAFLIIVSVVMSVIMLACAIMLLIKFSHPDDKNQAKFPKVVVIIGLFLSFMSILIMPYDISNTRGAGGGLRIDILWQIVHVILAIMVFFIIPFAYFFYENDMEPDESNKGFCKTQFGQALLYTIGFAIVFIIILVIMYAVINVAEIPVAYVMYQSKLVKHMNESYDAFQNSLIEVRSCENPLCDNTTRKYWKISVTFPIYLVAFLSFIGWFFFSIFVGVGLVALPMDMINEYRTRPKPLSDQEYTETKKKIGNWAKEISMQGQELKDMFDNSNNSRRQRSKNIKEFRAFEVQYNIVRQEYKKIEIARELKGENGGTYILWGYCKLVFGILGSILSLTWIIHICVFIFPENPVHPFLNDFFMALEIAFGEGFPLLGVLVFAMYSYYLLWCCIKGSFKIGLRFFIWKIYPMEVGGTLMNSFLVNTWLLLLCSIPTVQFCTQCFPVYARLTDVDMLFGTQVQYLKFFSYFWVYNVFTIAMIVLSGLTLIYLLVRPDDTSAKIQAKIEERSR